MQLASLVDCGCMIELATNPIHANPHVLKVSLGLMKSQEKYFYCCLHNEHFGNLLF